MNVLFRSLFLLLSLSLLVIGQQKITWPKDGSVMVLIPAGSFEMGDHFGQANDDERPVHRVELDAFYMDRHEVTIGRFRQFVNQSGYNYPDHLWNKVAQYSPTDDHPMVRLSGDDAAAYASWAGKRLPTEAEWEYAARGRLVGKRYPWGNEISRDYANYSGTGGADRWSEQTAPVGSFEANGYGLYDMAGNVWEWCADWYDEDYYSVSPVKNPLGPETGQDSVLRGGSWNNSANPLRLTHRSYHDSAVRSSLSGFRTVSSVETDQTGKLIGDVNRDGMVNIFDLVIVAGSFGQIGAGIMVDVNGDEMVNIFDLVIVAGNFGQTLATPSISSEIELSTQQKHNLASAIDQLLANSQRSATEEMVLGVLKAVLPERLPTTTKLLANYPNPFNPETWIPFELSQDAEVTVSIYDIAGQMVESMQIGFQPAGIYSSQAKAVYWDGKSQTGETVASGIYFYSITICDEIQTRRMVILK